jgi:hypothetical protein
MIPAQAVTEHLLLASASQTNSATRTANLDCAGASYATIRMVFASEINTNAVGPTISLLESDDTTVTNFATFSSDFERTAEDITGAKQIVYRTDLRGRKRYLRLAVTTATATNDNVTMGASATLSRKAIEPASEANQASDTNTVVVQRGL